MLGACEAIHIVLKLTWPVYQGQYDPKLFLY
jgi:hypothetical protein